MAEKIKLEELQQSTQCNWSEKSKTFVTWSSDKWSRQQFVLVRWPIRYRYCNIFRPFRQFRFHRNNFRHSGRLIALTETNFDILDDFILTEKKIDILDDFTLTEKKIDILDDFTLTEKKIRHFGRFHFDSNCFRQFGRFSFYRHKFRHFGRFSLQRNKFRHFGRFCRFTRFWFWLTFSHLLLILASLQRAMHHHLMHQWTIRTMVN